MRQAFLFLAAVFLLGGCRSSRTLTTENRSRDSTRIEVRTQVVHVPDTVYIEIPLQQAERVTVDSTSHLENDYAVSDARINPDGSLFHNLFTKPQKRPVATEKEIVYRDSIVYRNRDVKKTEIKEVPKKMSIFQKVQICGFWVLVIGLGLIIWKMINR